MLKKKYKYFVLFIIVLFLLFEANFVLALEINYPPVPVSGVDPPQVFLEKIRSGEIPEEQALSLYVKYFYVLFLIMSGAAAFFAIVYGGFLYLISVGSPAKMKSAREQISAGILGLVILLCSYLILTTINPQLTIFRISRRGITRLEFHRECREGKCLLIEGVGSDECTSDGECPKEGKTMYVEIPLGWLIERLKVKAQIARDQAQDVWLVGAEDSIETHTSLKELAECLDLLRQECKCDRETEECEEYSPNGQCPEGECRDPCDRCIAANFCAGIDNPSLANLCSGLSAPLAPLLSCPGNCNLRNVIDAKQAELDLLTDLLLMEREDAIIAKGILERELIKLKLAEALMRDALWPAISYHNFAALEEATSKTLEVWEEMEPIPLFSRGRWAGIRVPPGEGGEIISSPPGEEVSLLPYFKNTAGNNISSGEYFIREGDNPFKICKSGCANYEKFRHNGYVYHMEDTTWATAEGDVTCSDTGIKAFYRRYGSYGVNCNNHTSFEVGVPWVPKIMKVGETFTHPQSIVGFEEGTGRCCPTRYSGNLPHLMSLVYKGCVRFPTGVTSQNAIILRWGAGAENFYYDDGRGWIGWDRGVLGSGNYITDPIDPYQEDCLGIVGVGFPGSPGLGPEVTLPSHIEDDPANFYVKEEGNEELIDAIKQLDIILPPPEPPPYIPPLPPPVPIDVLDIELYCQNDPAWGGIRLGSIEPPQYMRRYGCNLTSFAMILRYFGFKKSPTDVDYNPGHVASFVNDYNLWQSSGTSNRNLFSLFKERESLSYQWQEITVDRVSEELSNGHPVFTGCRNFDYGGYQHWIVIKGMVGNDIYIADPYCSWESQGYNPYYKLSREEFGAFRCGLYYISFARE